MYSSEERRADFSSSSVKLKFTYLFRLRSRTKWVRTRYKSIHLSFIHELKCSRRYNSIFIRTKNRILRYCSHFFNVFSRQSSFLSFFSTLKLCTIERRHSLQAPLKSSKTFSTKTNKLDKERIIISYANEIFKFLVL